MTFPIVASISAAILLILSLSLLVIGWHRRGSTSPRRCQNRLKALPMPLGDFYPAVGGHSRAWKRWGTPAGGIAHFRWSSGGYRYSEAEGQKECPRAFGGHLERLVQPAAVRKGINKAYKSLLPEFLPRPFCEDFPQPSAAFAHPILIVLTLGPSAPWLWSDW